MEAAIRQRRLLFAGALTRQGDKRLPKRRLFAGRLQGGEETGPGQSAQHWQKRLRDDFKAFEALHGSTPTDRRTFGVDGLVWTDAARKEEEVPWYTGVRLRAERFMASWQKSQEEVSRLREVNRAPKALLANQKTKTKERQRQRQRKGKRGNAEEEGGGGGEREREGKRRKGASSNRE